MEEAVGVVGLGTMGARIAEHLARQGLTVLGYDVVNDRDAPQGVERRGSISEVAVGATAVCFSLPDGRAVLDCAGQLVETDVVRTNLVVDLSTIGVADAEAAHRRLATAGIGYVDSAVSGSLEAAATGRLSLMVGAAPELFSRARPLLALIGSTVTHVGPRPGLGQAMKLINNAISGTTLAVTSEALAVGCDLGLDLATMLDVLNVSSGRSVASERKFPEQVLTGAYAHGGPGAHFEKDIALFVELASTCGASPHVAEESARVWHEFARSWEGADQTEIFRYLRGEARERPGAGE